jgi:hypothetical protein
LFVSQVVYGLRLAANTTLPGLPHHHAELSPPISCRDEEAFDVRLRLKEWSSLSCKSSDSIDVLNSNSYGPAESRSNLRVRMLPGGGYLGLFYGDGVRFAVERRGQEVWADWPEDYTLEDACTYLIGPVMGLVLRLRGTVCLHASAVAIGDRAVALVGLPGVGKSTTAAAFACSGFPVLSDDVVALVDKGAQFLVQPGYPRVNLWPDSVRRLFGSEKALPRITPTWDKRYLPLGQSGHLFASNPLPLGAIYILDSRDEALTATVLEEVSGEEAFMALVANTYVNYLLDQDMRRIEFDVLGRVVSNIPIRRVRPPAEPMPIFNLCEAIAADATRVLTNATSVIG